MLYRAKLVAALAAGLIASSSAFAGAMLSGFDSVISEYSNLSVEKFDSASLSWITGFDIYPDYSAHNMLGSEFLKSETLDSYLSISRNGNANLLFRSSTDTPDGVINKGFSYSLTPHLALNGGSGKLTYGTGTYDGHAAFGINWIDITPELCASCTTQSQTNLLTGNAFTGSERNSFQVILVDRSDTGVGNFDIIFNYDSVEWKDYFGTPTSAVGFSFSASYSEYIYANGDDASSPSIYDDISFSHYPLYVDVSTLLSNSWNSDVDGRYIFEVRNPIPEPETWAMMLAGLGIVGAVTRRRRAKVAAM